MKIKERKQVYHKVTSKDIIEFERLMDGAELRAKQSQQNKIPLPPTTPSFGINFNQPQEGGLGIKNDVKR